MKYFLAFFFVFALALPAQAATLRVVSEGPQAGPGKTMVISVRLESGGQQINAVEGTVVVPEGVVIDQIDTGGSALSLFVERPRHVIADGVIAFTGGATTPLSDGALLFTIHAHGRNIGSYTFSAGATTAYLADGAGTAVAVQGSDAVVAVVEEGGAQHMPKREAGTALTAEYGQDPSVFDGKYFIALYGGDTGKGVEHYEVREGWWRAPVSVDSSYMLSDQSLRTTLWVSAVAPDGTKNTKLVLSLKTDYVSLLSLVVLLGVVGGALLVLRRSVRL